MGIVAGEAQQRKSCEVYLGWYAYQDDRNKQAWTADRAHHCTTLVSLLLSVLSCCSWLPSKQANRAQEQAGSLRPETTNYNHERFKPFNNSKPTDASVYMLYVQQHPLALQMLLNMLHYPKIQIQVCLHIPIQYPPGWCVCRFLLNFCLKSFYIMHWNVLRAALLDHLSDLIQLHSTSAQCNSASRA